MEVWKDILFTDGKYSVSSFGRVKNNMAGNILKSHVSTRGYEKLGFNTKDGKTQFSVHRLVCAAFYENPENKPQVNHKDLNQLNNHVDNLEWVTAKENTNHAQLNGRMPTKKLIPPIQKIDRHKKIINIETREIFDNVILLSKIIGYKIYRIRKMLSGDRYNSTSYRYLGEEDKVKIKPEKQVEYFYISVYDMQGNLVNKFTERKDFTHFKKVNNISSIACFLNGKRSNIKGFKFKLNNPNGSIIEPVPFVSKKPPLKIKKERNPLTYKQIIKYDIKGNVVEVFKSMGIAARQAGTTSNSFRKSIKRSPNNFYKGFIYKTV